MNETAKINTDDLKAAVDIVDVIGARLVLRRAGREYKGLCPFHDDTNPSLTVSPEKQIFWCPACDAKGDVIEFVMRLDGCTFREATVKLGAPGPRLTEQPDVAPKPRKPAPTEREPEIPPEGTEPPSFAGSSGHWCYHTADGRPWFFIVRHNEKALDPQGKPKLDPLGKPQKRFNPLTWAPADGWQSKAWPAPRPLYGLERLARAGAGAKVVLVEGEKCADAGAQIFPAGIVTMTWPGGAGGVNYVDLEPLRGHEVFIWPDADDAGTKVKDALVARLEKIAAKVYWYNVSEQAEKFDIADALERGWDYTYIRAWGKETIQGGSRLKEHRYVVTTAPAAILAFQSNLMASVVERATQQTQAERKMNAQSWDVAPWRSKLIPGGKDNDKVLRCTANCIVPFRHDKLWAGNLRWDEMAQTIRVAQPLPWGEQPVEWGDHHDVAATEWLDRTGMHYTKNMVADAVQLVAMENSFHPVREFLNNLKGKWDGVKRIETWLTTYCGASNNPYTQFAGKAMLVAAVARAIKPGVRVKSMLVLIGPQDIGKSEVFAILGGKWFGPQHGEIKGDAQKAKEQCTKLWLIEMSELATIRDSSVDAVKDFVSTSEDTYRPAYGRRAMTMPRCCVFVGTANADEIFRDETGNVRFWPVKIECDIDLEGLRRDREQIWAEAVAEYHAGFNWWITDENIKQIATSEQNARMVQDEWQSVISRWLDQPQQGLVNEYRLVDILVNGIGLDVANCGLLEQKRAASIMRRLGYLKKKSKGSDDAARCKVWALPAKDDNLTD